MLIFKAFTRKAFNYRGKAPGRSSVSGVNGSGVYSLQDFWASLGSSHSSGCPPTHLLSISERGQLWDKSWGGGLWSVPPSGHLRRAPKQKAQGRPVRVGAVRGRSPRRGILELCQPVDGPSLPLGSG